MTRKERKQLLIKRESEFKRMTELYNNGKADSIDLYKSDACSFMRLNDTTTRVMCNHIDSSLSIDIPRLAGV